VLEKAPKNAMAVKNASPAYDRKAGDEPRGINGEDNQASNG